MLKVARKSRYCALEFPKDSTPGLEENKEKGVPDVPEDIERVVTPSEANDRVVPSCPDTRNEDVDREPDI